MEIINDYVINQNYSTMTENNLKFHLIQTVMLTTMILKNLYLA